MATPGRNARRSPVNQHRSEKRSGSEDKSGPTNQRATKNQRRVEARERARREREAAKRRELRAKVLLRSGIVAGVVAVSAVVALVVVSGIRPAGPGPRNMASDGIVVGKGGAAVRTSALAPGATPTPVPSTTSNTMADIRIYSDFLCPLCGDFENDNKTYLGGLVESGGAMVDYHPMAILDRASAGSKYSTRSANAAACVADFSPDSYFAVNQALFAKQPDEGTVGLSDDELVSLVSKVEGLGSKKEIAECIHDGSFVSWVADSTARALRGPIPGTDADKITGTPTVFVNGKQFDSSKQTFKDFVTSVVGDAGETAKN